jgi:outer membrane protein insertion porin family
MDQTLPAKTQPIRANDQWDQSPRAKSSAGRGTILFVVAMIAFSQTGCQTAPFMKSGAKLPVPPPVLDAGSLDNTRFQSPDRLHGSGSRNATPNTTASSSSLAEQLSSSIEPPQADKANMVSEVIVKGNDTIPTHQLMANIRTRKGRYFDPDKLQQDVDQLWKMPGISRVNGPYLNRTPDGIIVTLEVVERNTIGGIEFIGNRGISDR